MSKGIKKTISEVKKYESIDGVKVEMWYDENADELFTTFIAEDDKHFSKKVYSINMEDILEHFKELNMKNLQKFIDYKYYKEIEPTWIDYYYDNRMCD